MKYQRFLNLRPGTDPSTDISVSAVALHP